MGRKSKELSEDRKQLVVDLKRKGHRYCEIVNLLHIPESTIRSIWKKYNSTGNVENIPRVGRPRKVTWHVEIRLLRTVKKNRGKFLREITNDFNEGGAVRVYPKTIQHYLHKNKIFRRVVRKKMVVREVNKKKRLSWCLERQRWTVYLHWNQVIFSEWGLPPRVHVSAISEEGVCYDLGVHYMVWCGNYM
jgi:transposase